MSATEASDDLAYVKAGISADLDTVLIFNLIRTHRYLSPLIDANLRQQNLTAAQFNTLLLLKAAGEEGLVMGEIGKRLIVTKSNVTGLVDRLERQGLVARGEHADRRVTVVRLADAGAALLEATTPPMARLLTQLTEGFTAGEKRTLVQLLTKLRRTLRQRRKDGL